MEEGSEVIDLTDDPPERSTTQDVIQYAGGCREPSTAKRRESTDSDVVLIEDEDDTGEAAHQPQVACHFFFPTEEDSTEGSTVPNFDPLAPIPEWVDCTTIEPQQQVQVDSESPAASRSPDVNIAPCAFVDPLGRTNFIKSEPGTEIDIKPSVEQLSEMVAARMKGVTSVDSRACGESQILKVKQEVLNNNGMIDSANRNISPQNQVKPAVRAGPKSAKFRLEKEKLQKEYVISTVENKSTSRVAGPKSFKLRLEDGNSGENNVNKESTRNSLQKAGFKCSKVRLNEEKIQEEFVNSTTLPLNQTKSSRKSGPRCSKFGLQEDYVNSMLPEKCTNMSRKPGPKSSKSRLNCESPSEEFVKLQNHSSPSTKAGPRCSKVGSKEDKIQEEVVHSTTSIHYQTHPPRKPGPKSAKIKFEEENSQDDYVNTTITPQNYTNMTSKPGPKCAKFKLKENKSQNDYANTTISPQNYANNTRKPGPKSAKFKLKEKDPQDDNINTTISPQNHTNNTRKPGPKCAKFKLKEEKSEKDFIKATITPQNLTNTMRKAGPKCSRFRSNQENTESSPSMAQKRVSSQEMRNSIVPVIKPAVVSIGPKLPLPQCFQKKQSPSKEAYHHVQTTTLDVDSDHIVLKIYTCFRCNHKCTDPLFHEEHLNICCAKRKSRSSNFSFQNHIKKNGFYKCDICTFKFKNEENLSIHLNLHGVKGFICHICQLNFLTLHDLNLHTVTDHKNLEKVFSCNICDHYSQNIHNLKEHMTRHNNDKYLYCSTCKSNFEDTEEIEKHRREFHKMASLKNWFMKEDTIEKADKENHSDREEKNPNCSTTEKTKEAKSTDTKIKSEASSKNHSVSKSSDILDPVSVIKRFEGEVIERGGKYHCNGCCYKFKTKANLMKHRKHHLLHRPFRCCGDSFFSFSYLDYFKHVQENHDELILNCSTCKETHTFTMVDSLGMHMTKHVSDGLYCHLCRKNSEDADHFKSHISAAHPNLSIGKYTCKKCTFFTPFEPIFKKHMEKHQKNKIQPEKRKNEDCDEKVVPKKKYCEMNVVKAEYSADSFHCKDCNLKFNSGEALTDHVNVVHYCNQAIERESGPSLSNEELRCNKCSFRCLLSSEFIKHISRGHRKRRFSCNVCKSDFSFLKLYLKHMTNHAACAVIYSCNECKFSSRKSAMFTKHMRTHQFKCCPLCDYKTRRIDSMKNHLETLHTLRKNENPSCSKVENHLSFNASSIGKEEEIFSDTHDSNFQNSISKIHSCCFCTFRTDDIDSLREHIAVHFNKSTSDNSKGKEELSTGTSKPGLQIHRGLTLKELKNKSVSVKYAKSKQSSEIGLTLFYFCTKCEYKSKCRRTTAAHAFKKHKLRGGLKNFAIKKQYIQMEHSGSQELLGGQNIKTNKIHSETDNRLCSSLQKHQTLSNKCPQSKQLKVPKEIYSEGIWKCSSCDLQKLSLIAQLQHKKLGHLRFWQKRLSCKICGYRCLNSIYLAKHHKWKHAGNKFVVDEVLDKDSSNQISGKFQYKRKKERKTASTKCSLCKIERYSGTAQYQHKKFGHDAFWNRTFSCEICKMRFVNRGSLVSHKKGHEKFLSCNMCKSFTATNLTNLKVHEESCKKDKESEIKSQMVMSKKSSCSSDNTESEDSDGDDLYRCGECDFVAHNVIEFSTHMFVHSGIPDD